MERHYLKYVEKYGADERTNDRGWMDSDKFLIYLDDFIKFVKPSLERPILLILDGYISHKKLETLIK